MRIHAYVLAADPTWLATSVLAYYEHIDKLVVSYDASGMGWTGSPIQVDACRATLRSIDSQGKIEWAEGAFTMESSSGVSYVEADTRQRQAALERASTGADWVLQIDTDEVLPRWEQLFQMLEEADRWNIPAVEWPMRILYRRLRDGRFLEVVTDRGTPHFEYPGPIAVRPGARLVDCRRVAGPFLRPIVRDDQVSLQATRAPEEGEHRAELGDGESAIWHNSWARPPATMRRKIASWSHNQGMKSWLYYYSKWLPAPATWRAMRRFHPLYPPLWPRLAVAPDLPFELAPSDVDG